MRSGQGHQNTQRLKYFYNIFYSFHNILKYKLVEKKRHWNYSFFFLHNDILTFSYFYKGKAKNILFQVFYLVNRTQKIFYQCYGKYKEKTCSIHFNSIFLSMISEMVCRNFFFNHNNHQNDLMENI